MTRRILALLALALVTLPFPATHGQATLKRVVDGRVGDWVGVTSRYGGTWQLSHGEFVYQDHIFDDLGAETRTRSAQHGTVSPPAGDFRYPADEKRYGANAADFLEVRFAADRDSLWILARMNTLKAKDSTVVAIAFDTDRSTSTGGGAWPYGAGLVVPGVDRVITLWGTGGTITKMPSGTKTPLADVAIDISNDNNAIEARVPRSLLGGRPVVRAWAATGIWDPAGRAWMAIRPGDPTATAPGGGSPFVGSRAFNVAFRQHETGSYFEEEQAAALADGDISAFHADVDLEELAAGRTRLFRVEPGNFYAVIMDQHLTIPPYDEGVSYTGVDGRFQGVGGAALKQTFQFYGRYQPYGLYVPSTYGRTSKIPAAFALHGLGGSHSTYNSQPGFLRDMGEGAGRWPPMFLITPLARGSSFYADWGEKDTFIVLDDVESRFPVIDKDRLYLTGYSMGGYGVYRLGTLFPDLFAGAVAWAGYTGEFTGSYLTTTDSFVDDPSGLSGAASEAFRQTFAPFGVGGGRSGRAVIGDPVDALDNVRYMPFLHEAGSNDEIVPTTGQTAGPHRLAELGYRSRFDLYPGYEHLSFALVDDWKQGRAWLGNARRTRTPRTITYKFSDGWTAPGLAKRLRLVHGNVWWLRDLEMRKTTTDALTLVSITATSHAVPERAVGVTKDAAIALDPMPNVQQAVSWRYGGALRVANRLDLVIAGVGRARVDLAQALLNPCGLSVFVRSDGRADVRITGRFPPSARIALGKGLSVTRAPDGIVLRSARNADSSLSVRCG
jgi:poly(3-hydroxybutyrate) depolymerase